MERLNSLEKEILSKPAYQPKNSFLMVISTTTIDVHSSSKKYFEEMKTKKGLSNVILLWNWIRQVKGITVEIV